MVRRVARPLVCIPTYNEASNILDLVERVHEAAPQADVLVIDHASPDCTGGFRCYSIRALQFLVTRPLRSSGYSALVELLTRCERGGLTIVELPITFTDRTRGESKISRQEIFRAMATVVRLAGRRN